MNSNSKASINLNNLIRVYPTNCIRFLDVLLTIIENRMRNIFSQQLEYIHVHAKWLFESLKTIVITRQEKEIKFKKST